MVEILDRAGIPVAPVNSYGDMTRDPHRFERNSLQPTRIEDGSVIPMCGPGGEIFARTDTRPQRCPGAWSTQ
jgi:crotonobetainyl-CoA:carnitine CoA-transferase CaiB-like acyl-CoA transferase